MHKCTCTKNMKPISRSRGDVFPASFCAARIYRGVSSNSCLTGLWWQRLSPVVNGSFWAEVARFCCTLAAGCLCSPKCSVYDSKSLIQRVLVCVKKQETLGKLEPKVGIIKWIKKSWEQNQVNQARGIKWEFGFTLPKPQKCDILWVDAALLLCILMVSHGLCFLLREIFPSST